MSKASISVALCTFNGARHLQAQLESIASQTLLPDELVVCDDGSHDTTVEIVTCFSASAPFQIHLTVNPRNLGSTKNFERAISLCQGDIIALCDQDDVWNKDKLRQIKSAFEAHPEAGAVFSDAEIVNELLQPLGYRLWQRYGFAPGLQRKMEKGKPFDVLLRQNVVTGTTFAFRSNFRQNILPIPECWIHDAWVALIIAALAKLIFVADPLVQYRQHSDNQIGGLKPGFRSWFASVFRDNSENYLAHVNQLILARDRLPSSKNAPPMSYIRKLESKIHHFQVRGSMPENRIRRLPRVVKELLSLRYFQFSNGCMSFAKDLLH